MMPYQGYPKQPAPGCVVLIGLCLTALLACSLARSSNDVEATVAAGVRATQQAEVNLQATINAAVAATQQASQAAPTPPSTSPQSTSISQQPDMEQVRSVILNEVDGAINRDLALLQTLYAPGAVVVDHKGTPADPDDDTQWQGWANIERRYQEFFSTGFTTADLVNLAIQVNGNQATATHEGVIFDGTLYEDQALYALERLNGQWLITRLEYGNKVPAGSPPTGAGETVLPPSSEAGLYVLKLGNQHRYEEPWGWDRGDPCTAWETGNFDDTKPNYRGFNVELLLTNNSDKKVPDEWPISFTTAKGNSVKACYYRYPGSGPIPDATSSVTFFTVVEKGDYVETITFSLEGQTVQLCLDGNGSWWAC